MIHTIVPPAVTDTCMAGGMILGSSIRSYPALLLGWGQPYYLAPPALVRSKLPWMGAASTDLDPQLQGDLRGPCSRRPQLVCASDMEALHAPAKKGDCISCGLPAAELCDPESSSSSWARRLTLSFFSPLGQAVWATIIKPGGSGGRG